MALNFQSRNIDTGLDFSDLPKITETVARITDMRPHYRHPYAGELVFTAFSGSHQDAIGKCLEKQKEVALDFNCEWKIPYLHIDPRTLGRSFEKFVRINSQSGKGGIKYVMEEAFGISLPKDLLLDFAPRVQKLADDAERELKPQELKDLFDVTYCVTEGPYKLERCFPRPDDNNPEQIHAEVHLSIYGKKVVVKGSGNGPISAFANAIRTVLNFNFKLKKFQEISLDQGEGVNASALAYITLQQEQSDWLVLGAGFGTNIDYAGFKALISCLNQLSKA